MAATIEAPPPDKPQYVDYDEYVDLQLEKIRSSIRFTETLTTLTALAVVVIGYLLGFVIFDQWVLEGGFGYGARVSLLSVLATGIVGTLMWRVFLPLVRRIHPLYAARVIEISDPNLKSNLVNFVDVRQSNAQSAPRVFQAMEKRAAIELSRIDVEEAVDRRPLLRFAYALLGVVVVSALYIVFSPKDPFASIRRALLPTAAIEVATETTISDVEPGNAEVPSRTILTIKADIRGHDADSAKILYTTADYKYVDFAVAMEREDASLPRFKARLNGENGRGLLQDLTYRIVAGDARTRDYTVTIIQPPSTRVDEVQYEFPPYMALENRTTTEGEIDGWEGTTVTVRATANMPLRSARIVLTDADDARLKGEEIAMQISDGTKLSATWKLEFRSDGTWPRFYHIDVRNTDGRSDEDPAQYALRIRRDQPPEVVLLAPAGDLTMPANGVIPLIVHAADPDFQVRSITLKATRGGDLIYDEKLFDDQLPAPAILGEFDFRLADVKTRLSEGETIQFWMEARDNKQPTANHANTPRINVHIGKPASPREVEEQLAEEKKKQDQLKRADKLVKPADRGVPPAPEAGDDNRSAPPQQRPGPRDPDGGKPANPPQEKEPENAARPERKEAPEGPKNRPDTIQEALQKLADREQQKQADEKNPEPAHRQPPDVKHPGEKRPDEKKPDEQHPGEKKPDGKKSDEKKPDGNNRQQANPAQRDRGEATSPGTSGAQPDKAERRETEKPQLPTTGATPDNAGGPGKSDGRNTSSRPDGDPPGTSPNAPDSKIPPNADKRTDSVESSEKPGPASPPATANKPASANKPADKDPPGDRSESPKTNDAAGKSNDPSNSAGPGRSSEMPAGDPPRGDADVKKSKTGDEKKAPQPRDAARTDKKEPAEKSPDAVKKKADRKDAGKATRDKPGDPQPPRTPDDVPKKPEPAMKKRSPVKTDPDARNTVEKSDPGDGAEGDSPDANSPKPTPSGREQPDRPGNAEGRQSKSQPEAGPENRAKRPGQSPDAGKAESNAPGQPQKQKPKQADSGKAEKGAANEQGKRGESNAGSGGQSNSKTNSGKPGDNKGEGSTTGPTNQEGRNDSSAGKETGRESGPAGTRPGAGAPPDSKSPPDSIGSRPGKPPTQDNARFGPGISSRPAEGDAPTDETGGPSDRKIPKPRDAADDEPPTAAEEQADHEHAHQVINLVLNRLKGQLERGEVDQELLDELGWNDRKDLEKLVKFLEDGLQDRDEDNSPEAVARRQQFEETLKSLKLGSETGSRSGGAGPTRRTRAIGRQTVPVPPEYRRFYESYTRSLSKTADPSPDKADPGRAKTK